jgi:hypothetical protein
MEAVTRKLDFALSAKTPDFLTTYAPQVAALRKLESADRAGLIERVAYTWFNRLPLCAHKTPEVGISSTGFLCVGKPPT